MPRQIFVTKLLNGYDVVVVGLTSVDDFEFNVGELVLQCRVGFAGVKLGHVAAPIQCDEIALLDVCVRSRQRTERRRALPIALV